MASFFSQDNEDAGYADLISQLQQQPETGQFMRYKTIPGAEESKVRELAMLKEFNQREQDLRIREKLARAMNAETGARTSGDAKGQLAAMASIESLLKGTGALDARDVEREKIASNEGLQRSLQDMTERQYVRQDTRAGKGQDLESILTDKRLSSAERVAALQDALARRGQDITQSEGRENRGLQKSMFEGEQSGLTQRQQAELANRRDMQGITEQGATSRQDAELRAKLEMLGLTEEGQSSRLDKTLGSQEKMSQEQMMNQKLMQAVMARLSQNPNDEQAQMVLSKILKKGGKSSIGDYLTSKEFGDQAINAIPFGLGNVVNLIRNLP